MKKVYLYIIIAAFLFGTMEVALKIGGSTFSPFQLTFLRFCIGGLILLPFAIVELRKNKVKLTPSDFLYMLVLGIIGIPLSMVLFQMGVIRSNASTAAVLISINPLFTAIFAHFILKERITKRKVLAILISLVGVFVIIAPWTEKEGDTFMGVFLTILAAILFAFYTALGKKRIGRIGTIPQTSISFLSGSLVLLVILLVIGDNVFTGVMDNIPLVLYTGIFVTGVAYLAYFGAIKLSDATTGSIAFFLKPAIAPFMAIIFLKEIIPITTVIGIVVILIGSVIFLRESKSRKIS